MAITAAMFLARILSLISESGFVSEIELELPDDVEQAGVSWNLLRSAMGVLLRSLILFAGVGGIHTGFGFCPETETWLHGPDVVHVVSASASVAAAIESTTHTRTLWIGRHVIPANVTLCRHCHFPLRFELLTRSRMGRLVSEWRRMTTLAYSAHATDPDSDPDPERSAEPALP